MRLLLLILLVPSAAAFHPAWEPVTWWGHTDGDDIWASRQALDAEAVAVAHEYTVADFITSNPGVLPTEGTLSWHMPLRLDVNETLRLSPGGNVTITVFFSYETAHVDDQAVPGVGLTKLSAALAVAGQRVVETPLADVSTSGWHRQDWTVVNPLSSLRWDQEPELIVTATGPATAYRIGLAQSTGWSHVSLPVALPEQVPEGEVTRSIVKSWQANATIQHVEPRDHVHIVNWTAPERVSFDAVVEVVQGEATIIVTDAAGQEVRRGGSIHRSILGGAPGNWTVTTILSGFVGNVTWTIADLEGPPPQPHVPPSPPEEPEPAPPTTRRDPPPAQEETEGIDPQDKEAPAPLWAVPLAAVLMRRRP